MEWQIFSRTFCYTMLLLFFTLMIVSKDQLEYRDIYFGFFALLGEEYIVRHRENLVSKAWLEILADEEQLKPITRVLCGCWCYRVTPCGCLWTPTGAGGWLWLRWVATQEEKPKFYLAQKDVLLCFAVETWSFICFPHANPWGLGCWSGDEGFCF